MCRAALTDDSGSVVGIVWKVGPPLRLGRGATRRAAAVLESRSSIPRVIVIALLAWSGANPPAQARAPYDGLWSVSLKVEQGSCGEHEIECSSATARSAMQANGGSSQPRVGLANGDASRSPSERSA